MLRTILTVCVLAVFGLMMPGVHAQMEMSELNQLYIRQNEDRVSRMIRLSQKDPEMFSRYTCISTVNHEIGSEVGFTPIVQRVAHYDFQQMDRSSISAEFISYTAIQPGPSFKIASLGQELPYFADVDPKEMKFSSRLIHKQVVAKTGTIKYDPYGVSPEVPHFASRGIHRLVIAKIGEHEIDWSGYDFHSMDQTSIAVYFQDRIGVNSQKLGVSTLGQPLPYFARVGGDENPWSSRSSLRLRVAVTIEFQQEFSGYMRPVCQMIHAWDPRDLLIDNTVLGQRMKQEADEQNLEVRQAMGEIMDLVNR